MGSLTTSSMASQFMFQTVYKTIDDCIIRTDVYAPKSASAKQLPTIIDIHGGAFMLGHSRMVNKDQIKDCIERGWIVVVPDHRLCPQVDILEGPMSDSRDLLTWIHDGHLDKELATHEAEIGASIKVDQAKIIAFGTSSGGQLAHAMAFGTRRAPRAVLDFYGAKDFTAPFWTTPLASMKPPPCSPEAEAMVYDTKPIPTCGGVSLEGQARPTGGPPAPDPRFAFAMNTIAAGRVLDVIYPHSKSELSKIDPVLNVTKDYPPTCIVHGLEDKMVPIEHSHAMLKALEREGVKCKFIEVEGEGHTFAGQMVKGGRTWETQRKGFDWVEDLVEGKLK